MMPDFQVIDERFRRLVMGNVHVEKLATGMRWAEGPAWFPAHRYLMWSDIPNNRQMRWDETDGSVSVLREPADNSNGNTVDRQGRLVTCHHRTRNVVRTEHDGSRTVLASHWEGKRLNSPNDVVVKSDGSVWFTDPSYGIDSEYEGDAAAPEIGGCHVYRLTLPDRTLTPVATDFVKPNGLAFSPDETRLYIVDSGYSHGEHLPRHIRVFDVQGDRLGGGAVFATCDVGLFDGLRVDVHGNVWTSAGDGVQCYAPDGTLLGKILIPEVVANCCFGGVKRNRLFICGTTSIYAAYLNTRGA
ncbi:MAG: SMP-30/gluconolactonase/LRE family protein [Rhodospirillales bacterium]|nr:SMP-30/gluconolactonase/LRE family protein [Rhodospirillales bacterium]